MAKRTSNRSSAEDSGVAAPAQPRSRRSRAGSTPAGPEPDTIAAQSGVQPSENNSTDVASEAGDDAPLESMAAGSASTGAQGESRGTQSTSMGSEPSEEDIRLRAYHRYVERGGGHGMDFEDWLEAERELRGPNAEVGGRK
jgi:Protein of unknown function (DUF2934)